MKNFLSLALSSALTLSILSGCSCSDPRKPQVKEKNDHDNTVAMVDTSTAKKHILVAMATINPTKGNTVNGTVTFTKVDDGIKIVADINGLAPGKHGFHIHEFGDCSDDAAAAGAHFNPTHHKHGSPEDLDRHVGDLGNLVADEKGSAHYERIDNIISFDGESSIIGRSIIVHADADDFHTQPAGASGAKMACGVIKAQ